jgi:hypothetical protein
MLYLLSILPKRKLKVVVVITSRVLDEQHNLNPSIYLVCKAIQQSPSRTTRFPVDHYGNELSRFSISSRIHGLSRADVGVTLVSREKTLSCISANVLKTASRVFETIPCLPQPEGNASSDPVIDNLDEDATTI